MFKEKNSSFTPRLVALDIDGTLVDNFGDLPGDVRRAVGRVVENGTPVVLSTGRSWLATKPIFDDLGLPDGWVVSSNGAMVLRYAPLDIVFEERFDPAPTIAKIRDRVPEARIAVQDGLHWRVNRPFPDGELQGDVTVEPVEELMSRPVGRVVLREPGTPEEEFRAKVGDLGLHEVSYFIGWSAWLDIAPQGIDKAHGLQRVVDDLGIHASDVLAIGDGRNDIEMLTWAGRGVAMGNAEDDVRAAADHVTGAFADGGVIEELGRWFR